MNLLTGRFSSGFFFSITGITTGTVGSENFFLHFLYSQVNAINL